MVQYPALLIIGQSTNKHSKHVDHEGRYDSMEDDVQHMEANRVKASHYEVVQPTTARREKNLMLNRAGETKCICEEGGSCYKGIMCPIGFITLHKHH